MFFYLKYKNVLIFKYYAKYINQTAVGLFWISNNN